MNKVFNSIKDYAKFKAEGCKDAVQIIKNNKGQLNNPAIKHTVLMSVLDTEKYAQFAHGVTGERLKNIGKVATAATATCCGAILTAIIS